MYLLFVDESGHPDEPLFSIGGLAVRADHWHELDQNLGAVAREFEWDPIHEFKWHEIVTGVVPHQVGDRAFAAIAAAPVSVFVVLLRPIAGAQIDAERFADPEDAYESGLLFLTERFNRFLEAEDSNGVVVIDNRLPELDRRLRIFYDRLRRRGSTYMAMDRLVDALLLSPSHFSRGLQAADLIVGMARGAKRHPPTRGDGSRSSSRGSRVIRRRVGSTAWVGSSSRILRSATTGRRTSSFRSDASRFRGHPLRTFRLSRENLVERPMEAGWLERYGFAAPRRTVAERRGAGARGSPGREGGASLRIFAFDPKDYRDEFHENSFVHIQGGISPEFLEYARDFARRTSAADQMEQFALGHKQQSLFEFPDEVDFPGELFDTISAMCGLERDSMTLSERHIKAYDDDTVEEPEAHKDRYASQVSMGLSLDIPRESHLVLWPRDEPSVNRYNTAHQFRRSLEPEHQPNALAASADEVVIDDQPGDVVAFHGSRLWHFRRRAAGATNVYLKMNDFGSDPLGEDPHTAGIRERTESLLNRNGASASAKPAKSRRLDFVSCHYNREWDEVLEASLWGDEPFGLTRLQFEVLRAADGTRTTRELAQRLAGSEGTVEEVETAIRRLAARGALDFTG